MTAAAAPPEARARAEAARAALGTLYPFAARFHDHGGVVQHYLDEGAADAPPALLVHGNPTWSFAWRRFVPELARTMRVVVPDHIGCGLSDKPQDYPYVLERHVENLERLVLSLDLKDITLVLHDWGGAIGMGFARRHPERVARLVLLNTAAFLSTEIPTRISICRVPVFGALAVRGLNGFARAATRMAVGRALSPDVRRGYLLPYDSYANRVAVHRFVQDIPLTPDHPSYPELEAIDASLGRFGETPTCLLWGMRDWCFTPSFLRVWQERLPHAEVHRFDEAAHYVFEDAADELLAPLHAFLAAHPLDSRSHA
ncbi:MAG: alpha/beta fold hydrolase [Planctomycetota bacterium]